MGVVTTVAPKYTSQGVVVKDFEPPKIFNTHRPGLIAIEQNRSDISIIYVQYHAGILAYPQ